MQSDDQPRTVLIVDDNRDLRTMVAEFLSADGFDVLEAEDGVEALRIVREERPDALLLDIMMPRLGGLATLEQLRAFDPDIQVIIMTAALDPALLRHAVFSGASAVLSKPLQLDDVAAALRWEPSQSAPDEPPAVAPRYPRRRRNILVVDDEPDVRSTIVDVLRGSGYDVRGVGDGASALDAMRAEQPDLVLLDVRMPGVNGIDVLASIRALDPHVRVIMITGDTRQNVANEAFARGAVEYIGKPIDPAYLELCVETALAQADP
jgi:CheY-like chemotaxis protein